MPKILKPRSYYNLTYSVIPDNKIKQVSGNYEETAYSETTDDFNVNDVLDCRGDGITQLPCVTVAEQQTTDNYFVDVFHDLLVDYDDDGEESTRTETVFAKHVIDIYDNEPMQFENTPENVNVSEATGIHRTRVSTGGWVIQLGWLINYDDAENKIYSIANFNRDGINSDKTTSEEVTGTINNVTVDSYYDGSHLAPNGQYLLRITIRLIVLDAYMYSYVHAPEYEGDPFIARGSMNYTLISSFKINIKYKVRGTEQTDFEYHVDESDYADYSLVVNGNEYTNSNTTYPTIINGETVQLSWAEWISKQILSRYRRGKIFINGKTKISYLLDNNIDIDSEIIIKDINNRYIARNIYDVDMCCIFKVKNIEYVCSDEEYSASITLLEDRVVRLYDNFAVGSNGIKVVDSNGIRMRILAELPYENYIVTRNNQKVVTSNNIKIKIRMEEL